MNKLPVLAATALLSFSLTACATDSTAKPAASAGPETAINAASAANTDAKSIGYEWRDTGKMIKQAEKLATEGKTGEAIKLAKKAEMQGKAAQLQAESQKTAGPRF